MKNPPEKIIPTGTKVITNYELDTTDGFMVVQRHIAARIPNARGVVAYPVPGHGGDVYFVDHSDGSTGAYSWSEFEFAEFPTKVVPTC